MAVIVIAGVIVINYEKEQKQDIEQIIQDESEQDDVLVSLETVRKEAVSLIEKGKNGEYRNLQFDDFNPLITEADQIYRIKVSTLDVEATEENLETVLDTIQKFYEEPILEDQITVNSFDGISVDELRKEIQEQNEEYTRGYYLCYLNGEQYAQINNCMSSLWIDLGLVGVAPSSEDLLDKVYYPEATDGSLEDVYETESGALSVEEAIEQVENYFNNEFPVSTSGEMEYRVARVYILKMSDDKYAFDFAMRRSYGGVPFESANSGTCAYEPDEVMDLTEAVLDKEDHVIFFNGYEPKQDIEEIQEISKVISPERATEYLSRKIGDNTTYIVKGIELSYTGKRTLLEEDGVMEEVMTPEWTFLTVSDTNGKEIRFYVDAVTGEVSTRQM